jgi:NAD(P)-dependent dehydrogenase (short-subunit alcohol dehydrogenase family)
MRLQEKVALMTGSAHGVQGEVMGFGGATAWLFSREGAKVVLTDIDEENGEKTASQIRDAGGDAIFLRLDVTKEQDWINAIDVTVSKFGKLNILLNNAGASDGSTVENLSSDTWDKYMDLLVKGAFLGTKYVIPEMRKQGGGSIVNIGSISGMGGGGSTAYRTGKAAIRFFTKATAIQYAKENIRANCIHPGYFDTPMTHSGFSDPESEYSKRHMEKSPMRRWGHVDDIAYGVLYLASDEASFVTGADLIIDGGVTAQE